MVISASCMVEVDLVIRLSSAVAKFAFLDRGSRARGNGVSGRLAREQADEGAERSVGTLASFFEWM